MKLHGSAISELRGAQIAGRSDPQLMCFVLFVLPSKKENTLCTPPPSIDRTLYIW